MACMYPNQLSPNTKSNAERRLYQVFQDELDDSYTVFHSVAWHSLDSEGRPRDEEADFVIVHPTRGILVLEAKGGVIRYSSRTWPTSRAWVGRALAYWRSPKTQRKTAPGEAAVQALMDFLGKGWELWPALWGDFIL